MNSIDRLIVANCFHESYALVIDVAFSVKWDHIGERGFEPPASASQTQRSDQTELLSVFHLYTHKQNIYYESYIMLRIFVRFV